MVLSEHGESNAHSSSYTSEYKLTYLVDEAELQHAIIEIAFFVEVKLEIELVTL